MKITISGKPGSGKSTVAKLVASHLGLKHYSIGDFMREMAKTKGISLIELSELAVRDPSIDEQLDHRQMLLKNEDNFVIDSRIGYHFFPDSVKIFLDVNIKEASKRIHKSKREEEKAETVEEIEKELEKRMKIERERYKKYYNLDLYDKNNYDLTIDTSKISAEKTSEKIIKFVRKK